MKTVNMKYPDLKAPAVEDGGALTSGGCTGTSVPDRPPPLPPLRSRPGWVRVARA